MKNARHLLIGLPMVVGLAVVLAVLGVGVASAETTTGKVVFLSTISEQPEGSNYHARLEVVVNGVCGSAQSPQNRVIIIRSGRMDGVFAHNGVNMRNAYSTLLAALLSGKSVRILEIPSCSTTQHIFLNLWNNVVGINAN